MSIYHVSTRGDAVSCVIVESETPDGVWRHGPRIRIVDRNRDPAQVNKQNFNCRYTGHEKPIIFEKKTRTTCRNTVVIMEWQANRV